MWKILLLFYLFLTSATAALVHYKEYENGAYSWEGDHDDVGPEQMKGIVKTAYDEMVKDAKDEGVVPPSTMAMIVVTGKGGILQSSVRNQKPDRQLINTCDAEGHRYQGNCGEMWGIDAIRDRGWQLKGAYVAVYGIKKQDTEETDWLHPCGNKKGKAGCETILVKAEVTCLTRRGLEAFDLFDVEGMLVSRSGVPMPGLVVARAGPKPGKIGPKGPVGLKSQKVGPTDHVGPTGHVGPTSPVGPTSKPGPTGSIGPTSTSRPTGPTSPPVAACRKLGKVKRFLADPLDLSDMFKRSLGLEFAF